MPPLNFRSADEPWQYSRNLRRLTKALLSSHIVGTTLAAVRKEYTKGTIQMKYIINENQIGYLTRNGKFEKVLTAGVHHYAKTLGYEVQITEATGWVNTFAFPVKRLMEDEFFAKNTVMETVPANSFAFVIVDGIPIRCVEGGQTVLYWNIFENVEIKVITPETPEVPEDFPRELINVSAGRMSIVHVPVGTVAMLYYDNRFVRELPTGVYRFWKNNVAVSVKNVTVAKQLLSLPAQELLTADKVTVRVTMALEYTVTEPRVYAEDFANGEEQLRLAAQLALRDYVGALKLEELLEKKSEFTAFMLGRLKASDCAKWCEFSNGGIKDIIIPGDIREIMNTVLVAEKQAQANVIARREEVASTRSLLNTAKMMEENPTLMRLKELEYLERICDRVDSISVSGGADLLGQLGALCKSGK